MADAGGSAPSGAGWLPAVALAAFALRAAVALQPHSGQGAPPMHGDMEAQRHWMEVTLGTPLREWYAHTPRNDLQYWGLDYPPLTYVARRGAALPRLRPSAQPR